MTKALSILAVSLFLAACSGSVGTNVFPGDEPKGDNEPSSAPFIQLEVL